MSQTIATNDTFLWVFFFLASLFVLYQAAVGWRRGTKRQAFHLLGMVCMYPAAWFGGPLLIPFLRPLGYADLLLSVVGGAAVALAVLLFVPLIGNLLFKNTSRYEDPGTRFRIGMGGAFLGVVNGALFVWALIIAIRLIGTVAEAEIAPKPANVSKIGNAPGKPDAKAGVQIFETVAIMKHSLENGAAGGVVRELDPIPQKAYDTLNRITLLLSSRESAERFLHFPGAQELVSNSKIVELRDDKGILDDIKARNLPALLKNPRLIQVMDDPEIHKMLKNFELEKALDYALKPDQKEAPPAGNP